VTPGYSGQPEPLLEQIRREIRAHGPIPFARFMELALYDPRNGYYATSADRLGSGGDFFTASDAGRSFGRCLARQIDEFSRLAGPFEPLDVVEFGAGRGLLARDILDAFREREGPGPAEIRSILVDRSAAMRAEGARIVPEARVLDPESLTGEYRGCVLAVELFDALPVHRVRRRGGRLFDIGVGLDRTGRLVEVELDPVPEVAELAARYGAAAEEGTEAEVCPAASRQFDRLAAALEVGLIVIVDYGHQAAELYGPLRRHGTLLAYRGHSTNEQFLEDVGLQDLTAHVNFTALEDRARELGLSVLGTTTQDRFLVANGILRDFEQADVADAYDPRLVKKRLQAMQLIHPEGMGRTFKVMLATKGCAPPPELSGLRDPFARS
jgi:SAM-dependent MidA family methyltransferase